MGDRTYLRCPNGDIPVVLPASMDPHAKAVECERDETNERNEVGDVSAYTPHEK